MSLPSTINPEQVFPFAKQYFGGQLTKKSQSEHMQELTLIHKVNRIDQRSFAEVRPHVYQDGESVTMQFQIGEIQSEMLVSDPNFLVLSYTRTMIAFLLFHEAPERVDSVCSVETERIMSLSLKAFVVCRNIKLFSQGNRYRADLDHGDIRGRKLLIAPLRHRAATQPNHYDPLSCAPEIRLSESLGNNVGKLYVYGSLEKRVMNIPGVPTVRLASGLALSGVPSSKAWEIA